MVADLGKLKSRCGLVSTLMDVFVDKHLSLLSQERDEELSEGVHLLTTGLKNLKEKEEKGHCVTRLQVESQRIGLYGRCVISFELSKKLGRKNIPVNSISSGKNISART